MGLLSGTRPRVICSALFAATGFLLRELCKSWMIKRQVRVSGEGGNPLQALNPAVHLPFAEKMLWNSDIGTRAIRYLQYMHKNDEICNIGGYQCVEFGENIISLSIFRNLSCVITLAVEQSITFHPMNGEERISNRIYVPGSSPCTSQFLFSSPSSPPREEAPVQPLFGHNSVCPQPSPCATAPINA